MTRMDKKDKLNELKKYRYTHRGYHDKPDIPENSMAAFRRTKENGWGSETDVHLLADGKLAIVHDSDLERVTGKKAFVEDLKAEDLINYTLEASSEHIPLLEELLALKLPLIVELKVERGNYRELCAASWEKLKDYKAPFCIESFDPRAVLWYRRNHPEVVRGQLAANFLKDKDSSLKPFVARLAANLAFNFLTKPDFVAYMYEDRNIPALVKYLKNGGQEVSWTIRSKKDLLDAESLGCIPIFECFDPDE